MLTPEIITGLFGLGTTVIAALIRMDYMNRKRLKEKLTRAEADIQFLLAVEAVHCLNNQKYRNASFKNRVRNEVYAKGLTWSGSFTPGRVRASQMLKTSTFATSVAAHVLVLVKHGGRAVVVGAGWAVTKLAALPRAFAERTRGKHGQAKAST